MDRYNVYSIKTYIDKQTQNIHNKYISNDLVHEDNIFLDIHAKKHANQDAYREKYSDYMLHAKYIPFNAPLMQHYAFISCFKHASKMHIHAMLDAHAQDKNSFTLDMRLYVCRKALILCKDTLQTITSLSCSLQK